MIDQEKPALTPTTNVIAVARLMSKALRAEFRTLADAIAAIRAAGRSAAKLRRLMRKLRAAVEEADRIAARASRVLEQDAEAWLAGFEAGKSGASLKTCPYATGTAESWAWSSGFIEGRAKGGASGD
jgi:ribosome modulation factor